MFSGHSMDWCEDGAVSSHKNDTKVAGNVQARDRCCDGGGVKEVGDFGKSTGANQVGDGERKEIFITVGSIGFSIPNLQRCQK